MNSKLIIKNDWFDIRKEHIEKKNVSMWAWQESINSFTSIFKEVNFLLNKFCL